MKRGDIVLVASPGEFGKPRPALIIQSDRAYSTGYFSYLPITSDLLRVPDIRVPVPPTEQNGLRVDSEVMVDMIHTSSLAKFRPPIGSIDPHTLSEVEKALNIHLGLA